VSHPFPVPGEAPASLEALLAWVEAVWRLLAADGDANQALALALRLRELQAPALKDDGTDPAALHALRAMLRETGPQAVQAALQRQALWSLTPGPAAWVNAQGLALAYNPAAQRWLGAPARPEAPCRRWLAALGPTGARAVLGLLDVDMPLGVEAVSAPWHGPEASPWADAVQVRVSRWPSPEGEPRWLLWLDGPLVRGRPLSTARLAQALMEQSPDPIYATDAEGRLRLANPAMLDAFGLDPAQALGRTRADWMPWPAALKHERLDHEVTHGGLPQTIEDTLQGEGERRTRHFSTLKFPLVGAAGKAVGVGAVARDVTEAHRERYPRELSELVFRHSADAIVVTDLQTRIERVNPAFERMSGWDQARVLGRKVGDVLRSGRHPPVYYEAMWRSLNEHGHWGGEFINRHATGRLFTVWTSISVVGDAQGQRQGYMSVQTDMTALKAAQHEAMRLAQFDILTGLPNRALMADRLGRLVSQAQRQQGRFAVMFVDLDHFKEVNDALGHETGDALLRRIAQRLAEHVRAQDTVARIGGDEFVLLLPQTDQACALTLAAKLQRVLAEPLDLDRVQGYRPQASLGIAVYPDDGLRPEVLLRHADTAMYQAKAEGRNRVKAFSPDMGAAAARDFELQHGLAAALTSGELRLHYQPKFHLRDGQPQGAEALLRWHRAGGEVLQPGQFLPALEKGGLMTQVDAWVMQQTVRTALRWQAQGRWPHGWVLSFNQSAPELRQPSWLQRWRDLLDGAGLAPGSLEVELTEGTLAQPTAVLQDNLAALRGLGVGLSVDDFGTGYSSLAYLMDLPITRLKIDQRFVRDLLNDATDRTLVEAIVSLGRKLGFQTVAEGVETDAQRQALHDMGCEQGQGFLCSPALPEEDFERRFLPWRP